jgi:hypothetical protein
MEYPFNLQFFGEGDPPLTPPAPTPPASPTAPDDKKPGTEPGKTFTQADLDKIVEKRLNQERKKYADYEDNKKKIEELTAQLEASKTPPSDPPKPPKDDPKPNDEVLKQLEELRKETEALRKEQAETIAKAKKQERDAKVSKEFEQYPEAQRAILLQLVKGDTDEEVSESVKSLKELFPAPKNLPTGGPTNPPRKNPDEEDSPAIAAAREAGKKRREEMKRLEALSKK